MINIKKDSPPKSKEPVHTHSHLPHNESDHQFEEIIPVAKVLQSIFCLTNDNLVLTDAIFYISDVIMSQIEFELGITYHSAFMKNFVNEKIL